jgi:hypothetical protein
MLPKYATCKDFLQVQKEEEREVKKLLNSKKKKL